MADNNVTVQDLMQHIVVLLRYVGCDPKHKSHVIFHLICYYFILSNIFWTIFAALQLMNGMDNMLDATTTFITLITASQVTFKAYALQSHPKELSALMDVLTNQFWDSQVIKGQTNKYNKWFNMILWSVKLYRGLFIVGFIYYFASPVFHPIRLKPELHKTPTHAIMYIIQFSNVFPCVLCLTTCDLLFIVMVSCVNMQFDMLKQQFMIIVDGEKMDEEHDEERENKAYEKLKAAVVHHNLCLDFVSNLEDFFGVPLLKQYIDAISCTGVLIYLGHDFQFFFLFLLICNLFQTLYYSFCGQRVQDGSGAITDAAYESGWENIKSPKLRKSLALVIQRANRRVKITAGGFIELSFESFVGMMQAAFSFLTVLRSTSELNK